jgi:hypothetical protein
MSSQKFSDSNLTPLPPAKPDTLLVSDPLTRAEFLPVGPLFGAPDADAGRAGQDV